MSACKLLCLLGDYCLPDAPEKLEIELEQSGPTFLYCCEGRPKQIFKPNWAARYGFVLFRSAEFEHYSNQRLASRHSAIEQQRIGRAIEAIHDGKALILGNLLDQSEFSLSSNITIDTPKINQAVAYLIKQRGVIGARRCRLDDQTLGIIALIEIARYKHIENAIGNRFGDMVVEGQAPDHA